MSDAVENPTMDADVAKSVAALNVSDEADDALDREEEEDENRESSEDSDDESIYARKSEENEKKVGVIINVSSLEPKMTAKPAVAVPKHVALSSAEISPVSGKGSPQVVKTGQSAGARFSRVTFPGERAFTTEKTDSEASEESVHIDVEHVTTLDGDALGVSTPLEFTASGVDDIYTDLGDDGDVDEELAQKLLTHAVDICVEVHGMAKGPLMRYPRALFVALFCRGPTPGSWRELGRTEAVTDPRGQHRWVRKLRVAAATVLDRTEVVSLAVFEDSATAAASRTPTAGPAGALATCRLQVSVLLSAPVRSLDLELASPRTGRVRGVARIAADLVPHVAFDERLAFDVVFANDAPARNRILYVISRSLPRGRWTPVYRSEVRTRDDLANFSSAILRKRELNTGNDRRLIRIEFYRFYKNLTCTLLGFCQTSLLSLRTCPLNAGLYWWSAEDGISNAKIVLTGRSETEESSAYVLRVVPASYKSMKNTETKE